jgi:hypothetical protein
MAKYGVYDGKELRVKMDGIRQKPSNTKIPSFSNYAH